MKINKTYILRERAHLSQTIIEIRGDLVLEPLSDYQHETLDRLEEITDLHFCFISQDSGKIDFERFSESYRATSYSINPDSTGISGIMEAIHYDRVLSPGQHILWFIVDLHGSDDQVKTVRKIIESSEILQRSIYNVQRLGPEDLWKSYQKVQKRLWKFWETPDRTDVYSTHEALIDPVIVLRPAMIDLIYQYDQKNPDYAKTFPRFTTFLGSITDRIPGAYSLLLKQSPRDVKINPNRL